MSVSRWTRPSATYSSCFATLSWWLRWPSWWEEEAPATSCIPADLQPVYWLCPSWAASLFTPAWWSWVSWRHSSSPLHKTGRYMARIILISDSVLAPILIFCLILCRYIPTNSTVFGAANLPNLENTSVFDMSGFQYIIMAVVVTKGYPHKKPLYYNGTLSEMSIDGAFVIHADKL